MGEVGGDKIDAVSFARLEGKVDSILLSMSAIAKVADDHENRLRKIEDSKIKDGEERIKKLEIEQIKDGEDRLKAVELETDRLNQKINNWLTIQTTYTTIIGALSTFLGHFIPK